MGWGTLRTSQFAPSTSRLMLPSIVQGMGKPGAGLIRGEIVLRAGRGRYIWTALAYSALAILGASLIVYGYLIGVLLLAAWLLAGIAMLARLLAPDTLTLRPDGFSIHTFGRAESHHWRDIEWFYATRLRGRTMVTWRFAPHRAPPGAWRTFLRSTIVDDAALPDTYGMRARELAALMNEWREAANVSQGQATHAQ
jgi:hypothetical protein